MRATFTVIVLFLLTARCATAETEAQQCALFKGTNPLKAAMGKPIYAHRVFQHGYHCWDPALIKVGNTYHLFYSRWKMVPGRVNDLANWMTTSEIVHAVSKNLVGPYENIENPQKIESATKRIRVKIAAEPGFDPHEDVAVDSLRFGASEAVDFGGGARPLETELVGSDLVVVFDAQGHGLTEDNFAAKLIGRTSAGKLLFGYARLPWLDYLQPALSALPPEVQSADGRTRFAVEVENFGQMTSQEAKLDVRILDGGAKTIATATAPIPALAPYEKTGVALELKWKLCPFRDHDCQLVIQHPGQTPEILRTVIRATENRPSLLEGARAELSSEKRPNANQGVAQLIDGDPRTKLCIENKGETVIVDLLLPHPVKAAGYAFTSADDVPDRDPKDWEVQAGNDGQTWETLSRAIRIRNVSARCIVPTFMCKRCTMPKRIGPTSI